jgi:hypothetical protein
VRIVLGARENRLGLVPPWTVAAMGVPEQARASFAQCSRSNAYKQLRRGMPPQRPIWVISRGLRSPRACPASTRNPRFRAPRLTTKPSGATIATGGLERVPIGSGLMFRGQTAPALGWFSRGGTRPCVRVPPADRCELHRPNDQGALDLSARQHGAGAAGPVCAAVPARTANLDQAVVSVNEVALRVGPRAG